MKIGTRLQNIASGIVATVTHSDKHGVIVQRPDGTKAAYSTRQAKALLRKP